MTVQRYDELLELPHSHSPVQPLNFLIDSGSDISLCWNYDLFTFVEPCSMKSYACIPVGSTPLNVHVVGVVRFCLGSCVDHLGQKHPLDIEIPSLYYVPQSSFNILSTTHLKRHQITFNTQFDNDVLIMPGLPSQVMGIWGDWHQVIGPRGYPSIYITLGNNKPVMRTFPVDSGTARTSAACAVDQVREPCERQNVDVAALKEKEKGFDVTPEFLAHLTFNHCGDSGMKLMGRHPELYNLSLGTRDSIVGQVKHCLGCMIANMRLGARAMYNHVLAKPAEAAGECYCADVAGPILLWESVGPNTFLLLLMSSRDTCMSFLCAVRVRQPLCWPSCLNAFIYKLFDRNTLASRGCTLTREVNSSRETWNNFALGGVSCIRLLTQQLISPTGLLRGALAY